MKTLIIAGAAIVVLASPAHAQIGWLDCTKMEGQTRFACERYQGSDNPAAHERLMRRLYDADHPPAGLEEYQRRTMKAAREEYNKHPEWWSPEALKQITDRCKLYWTEVPLIERCINSALGR